SKAWHAKAHRISAEQTLAACAIERSLSMQLAKPLDIDFDNQTRRADPGERRVAKQRRVAKPLLPFGLQQGTRQPQCLKP
ncbi:MAG: hypothetical protein WCA23_03865, partial [Stellaceae bacterium]